MPRSSSNDFILVVPYYSRRLPTGRHDTARHGTARRLLNWSPVDGSDFVVVFLDFSNYHPVKVAKCLVTSTS